MLFTRLARTIIKHNRAVFVIWLVALALSVPAILQVQSVIVYTETAYNPKTSESSIAQSIVSKEFSISQGSSVVVVITSPDVRGNDVRDFTLTFNKTLHNDRTITNLSNVTSIYDIYYQLLVGYTSVVHLQLYQEKNLTSLATSLEFGIPAIYVNQWTTLVNSGPFNITQAQVAAYNQKANQSTWLTVSSQTPQAYLPLALAYQNRFYQSWNMTFTAASYTQTQLAIVAPPLARAQNVTKGNPVLANQPAYYNITLPYFQSSVTDPEPALSLSIQLRSSTSTTSAPIHVLTITGTTCGPSDIRCQHFLGSGQCYSDPDLYHRRDLFARCFCEFRRFYNSSGHSSSKL